MPTPLPWKSVEAHPGFRALPDADKEAVKNHYFETQVMPHPSFQGLDNTGREKVRQHFFAPPENAAGLTPAAANAPPPERGMLGDLKTAVLRGITGDTAATYMDALAGIDEFIDRFVPEDPESFDLKQLANLSAGQIKDWRDKHLALSAEAGEDDLRGWITQGVESATHSLAVRVPGAAAGAAVGSVVPVVGTTAGAVIGFLSGAPLFGAAQYNEALHEARKRGLKEDEAHSYAAKMGASETIFEFVSDGIELLTLGAGRALTAPGKALLKESLHKMLKAGWKQAVKTGAGIAFAEGAGEMMNVATQAEIARYHGLGTQATWEAVKQQLGPVTVASLIFGVVGGGLKLRQPAAIRNALQTTVPEGTPAKLAQQIAARRVQAAKAVKDAIAETSPDLADQWAAAAYQAVLQNQPIDLATPVDQFKVKPPAAEAEAPLGSAGQAVTHQGAVPAAPEAPRDNATVLAQERAAALQEIGRELSGGQQAYIKDLVSQGQDLSAIAQLFPDNPAAVRYAQLLKGIDLATREGRPVPTATAKKAGEVRAEREAAYAELFPQAEKAEDDARRRAKAERERLIINNFIAQLTGRPVKSAQESAQAMLIAQEENNNAIARAQMAVDTMEERRGGVSGHIFPDASVPIVTPPAEATAGAAISDSYLKQFGQSYADLIHTVQASQKRETNRRAVAALTRGTAKTADEIRAERAQAIEAALVQLEEQEGPERVRQFIQQLTGRETKSAKESAEALLKAERRRKYADRRVHRAAKRTPTPASSPKVAPVRTTPPASPAVTGADEASAPEAPNPVASAPGVPDATPEIAIATPKETRPAATAVAVGGTGTSYTPKNRAIAFDYALVESADLVRSHDTGLHTNPDYPAALQPRRRERKAMIAQVEAMAKALLPAKLGAAPGVGSGAPMVGDDLVVESGNGRTIALQKAYDEGHADGYKEWLTAHAADFGFEAADVEALTQPVLVRIRRTAVDRAAFTKEANQDEVARMSPYEQAQADAERLTAEDMALVRPTEDGRIAAAGNQAFINTFLDSLGANEAAGLLTAEGQLTRQGADRIQAAVFAKAYQDEAIVTLQSEEASPDIKNILNALIIAAGAFAQARGLEGYGELDIVPHLTTAAKLIRRSRAEGLALAQILDQRGMFDYVDPTAETLARFMDANIRSAKRMGAAFRHMATAIRQDLQDRNQSSLFDDKTSLTPNAAIQKGIDHAQGDQDRQATLFEEPAQTGRGARQRPGSGRTQTGAAKAEPQADDGEVNGHLAEPTPSYTFTPPQQKELPFNLPGDPPSQAVHRRLATRMATTGSIAADGNLVQGIADAASLLASLRKQAQENAYVVVTDANGLVLEIHRYSKGIKNAANIAPVELAGRVLNVPGAHRAYFAHNHPSGDPSPSPQDRQLVSRLEAILDLAGIRLDSFVIGRSHYRAVNGLAEGPLRPAVRRASLPFKERLLRATRDYLANPIAVNNAAEAAAAIKALYENREGFLFLDAKNKVVGFLDLPAGKPTRIAAADVIAEAEATNAVGVVMNATKPPNPQREALIRGIAGGGTGLQLLDVIDRGQSMANQGLLAGLADDLPALNNLAYNEETLLAMGEKKVDPTRMTRVDLREAIKKNLEGKDHDYLEAESARRIRGAAGRIYRTSAQSEAAEQIAALYADQFHGRQTIVTIAQAQQWLTSHTFPRITQPGRAQPTIARLLKNKAFQQLSIFDRIRVAAQLERPLRGRDYKPQVAPASNRKLSGGTIRSGQNRKVAGADILAADTVAGCDHYCYACYALKGASQSRINHQHPVMVKLNGLLHTGEVLRIGEKGDPSKDWTHTHAQVSALIERSQKSGHNVTADDVFYITKLLNLDGFNPETARNLQVSLDPMYPEHMWRSMMNIMRLKAAHPEVNVSARIRTLHTTNPDLHDAMMAAVDFANDFNLPILETRMRFIREASFALLELDRTKYKRTGNQFKPVTPVLQEESKHYHICEEKDGQGCPGCRNCIKLTTGRDKWVGLQQKIVGDLGIDGVALPASQAFDPVGWSADGKRPRFALGEKRKTFSPRRALNAMDAADGQRLAAAFELVDQALREAGLNQKEIERITVELKTVIDLRGKDAEGSLGQWARSGKQVSAILGATTMRGFNALVELSLEQDLATMERTAFHEAFHVMARWVLSPDQYGQVMGHFKGNEEIAADAFSAYVAGQRDAGPIGPVQRIFDELKALLQRLGNLLRGRGFSRPEDIFEGLRSGRFRGAGRPSDPRTTIALMAEERAQRWYSQLVNHIEKALPGKGTPQQFKDWLDQMAGPPTALTEEISALEKTASKDPAVRQRIQELRAEAGRYKGQFKREELEWSGLMRWLDDKIADQQEAQKNRAGRGTVTKQEVLDHLARSHVYLVEKIRGARTVSRGSRTEIEQARTDLRAAEEALRREEVRVTNLFVEKGGLSPLAARQMVRAMGREWNVRPQETADAYQKADAIAAAHPDLADHDWNRLTDLADDVKSLEVDVAEARQSTRPVPARWDEDALALPGGENYGEIELMLPRAPELYTIEPDAEAVAQYQAAWDQAAAQWDAAHMAGDTAARDQLEAELDRLHRKMVRDTARRLPEWMRQKPYISSHWPEENVLVHVRFNERQADGKRMLHIEEIQSDWHQEGRDEGYKDAGRQLKLLQEVNEILRKYDWEPVNPSLNKPVDEQISDAEVTLYNELSQEDSETLSRIGNEYYYDTDRQGTVPDAPWKGSATWGMLAFRRMVRYAAENGFDGITWTPGIEQVRRYERSTSRVVDAIHYRKAGEGRWDIRGVKNGRAVVDKGRVDEAWLKKHLGKRIARQIVADTGQPDASGLFDIEVGLDRMDNAFAENSRPEAELEFKVIEGEDLTVGGEGMKSFYDRILVNEVNRFFGKKTWGRAKVGPLDIGTGDGWVSGEDVMAHLGIPEDQQDAYWRELTQEERDRHIRDYRNEARAKVWHLPVTPEMRRKTLTEGMPLFRSADPNDQGHIAARRFNEAHPGHDLRYDGHMDLSVIGKPPLHQFTAYAGPANRATFTSADLALEAVAAKFDAILGPRGTHLAMGAAKAAGSGRRTADGTRIPTGPETAADLEANRSFVNRIFEQRDVAMHLIDVEVAELQRDVQQIAGGKSIRRRPTLGFAYQKDLKRSADSDLLDQALMVWRDMQRNPEKAGVFRQWARERLAAGDVPAAQVLRIKKQLGVLDRAERLSEREKSFADEIGERFEAAHRVAAANKVLQAHQDHYVRRIWDFKEHTRDQIRGGGGYGFQVSTTAAKPRVLETILDGWMAGYDLSVKGLTNAYGNYKKELETVIANKDFIQQGYHTRDREGLRLFSTTNRGEYAGYVRLEHPNFTVWEWAGKVEAETGPPPEERMLADDRGRDFYLSPVEGRREAWWVYDAPDAEKPVKRFYSEKAARRYMKKTGLTRVEHKDARAVANLWERRALYAPPQVAEALNKMLAQDKFFPRIPGANAMLRLNASLKSWILLSSFFHHLAGARSWAFAVAHGFRGKTITDPVTGEAAETAGLNPVTAYKMGLRKIEDRAPLLHIGIKNGLTLGEVQDWSEMALLQQAGLTERLVNHLGLEKPAAIIAAGRRARENFTNSLFKKFFAGLKAEAFCVEFAHEVQVAQERGDAINLDKIAERVARLINADFGGLHLQRMGRHPTLQKILRLLLLAPDWTESNFRTVTGMIPGLNNWISKMSGGLPGPEGMPDFYRRFWVRVALRGIASTVLIQLLLNGWDDTEDYYEEQLFSKQWNKFRWTGVDLSQFYDALGIDREGNRKIFSIMGHFKDPLKLLDPVKLIKGKGSPAIKMVEALGSGSNWREQPYVGAKEFATTTQLWPPKLGRVTKKSPYEPKETSLNRLPATAVDQIISMQPVQVGYFLRWLQGEEDGLTALMQSAGSHINTAFAPPSSLPADIGSGPAAEWLERLQASGHLTMGPPSPRIMVGGTPVKLTAAEYRAYQEDAGERTRRKLEDIAGSDRVARMPPARQAALVERVIKSARKKARQTLKRRLFATENRPPVNPK